MKFEDQYFKSAFSVDCVIFGFDTNALKVLLIRRGAEPMKGSLAIPGDLVSINESLEQGVERVLNQSVGISNLYMEQVYTFGRVDRHPDGRVITIAYYALVNVRDYKLSAASFAESADWYPVSEALELELGFDHNEILQACFGQLKLKVQSAPIGFELLPKKFTLSQLQLLYELILERDLDKRNFRKKILSLDILTPLNEKQKGVAHRPAKLYQFDEEKYRAMKIVGGLNFDAKKNS